MDKITIERISQAHPDIREKLLKDYTNANNLLGKGSRLRFAWVYRTPAEQDALYKKRPKVTNARAWQSLHNYGIAFDIVMLYDNDKNGTFEEASWSLTKDYDKDGIPEWTEVVNYMKLKGWEWGGDWQNFKDKPHFQLPGYTWRELKAKMEAGNCFTDNGIKYVNL